MYMGEVTCGGTTTDGPLVSKSVVASWLESLRMVRGREGATLPVDIWNLRWGGIDW